MDPTTTVPALDDEAKSPQELYAAHILELTACEFPTAHSVVAPPPVTSFEPDLDGYVVSIREIIDVVGERSVCSERSVPSVIQIPYNDDNNSIATTKMSDDCTVSVTTSEAATANSQQLSFLTTTQTTKGAHPFPIPQQILQASLLSSFAPVAADDETWAAGDLFASLVTSTGAAATPQQQQLNEEARLQRMMQLFEQMVIVAAVQVQCSSVAGIACAEQRRHPCETFDILEQHERNHHSADDDEHQSRPFYTPVLSHRMPKMGRCGDPPEVRNTNPYDMLVAPDPPVVVRPPSSFSPSSLQNRSNFAAANDYDTSDDSQRSVASVKSNATSDLSSSTSYKDALMSHKDFEDKSCSTASKRLRLPHDIRRCRRPPRRHRRRGLRRNHRPRHRRRWGVTIAWPARHG